MEAIPCRGSHKRAVSEISFRRICVQIECLSRLLLISARNKEHFTVELVKHMRAAHIWKQLRAGAARLWAQGHTDITGGSCEIRTHGGDKPSPVFKTGALNRSAKLPCGRILTVAWGQLSSDFEHAPGFDEAHHLGQTRQSLQVGHHKGLQAFGCGAHALGVAAHDVQIRAHVGG